ncbi:DUF4136 domain-containing protein [Ferrimonas marina]|uniref:DUF4136 domain-containing protein n=1 Tax=Ferrimonas marina TaxID=299255 RepID=A0A1M5YEC1_9GAMM|nr:DUF4136 domain-containing protein [Ferrimonas marina]SHI09863.1 protein of unknown function [Ferrimonas marina]
MKKLFAMAAALMLAGCSTIQTDSDYDTSTQFSNLKTWAWVEKSEVTGDDQYHMDGLMDQRVRNAITNTLQSKGLSQVDAADADILVNYLTKIEKKVNVDTFYSSFGYHPYYYGRYPFHAGVRADTRVREYQEGTLLIDLVDNENRTLIWRGSGTDTLKQNQTPAQRTEQVNEVVSAIMEQFPPQ